MNAPIRDLRSPLTLAVGWIAYLAALLTDAIVLYGIAGLLFGLAILTVIADIRARRHRPRRFRLPPPPTTATAPPRREPPASVRQGAGALHGMYTALVDSGFTHDDAMRLVADALTASQRDK